MKLISLSSPAVLTLSLSVVYVVVAYQAPHFIKSNAVIRLRRSDVSVQRHRRQAQPLSPKQKSQIVEHHNLLRSIEGADNMELMTWSDFLASLGVTWAAGCKFEHGQPPLGSDPAYTVIGQNLYASTVDNISVGVQAWYDEKVDYNYDTLTCAANKVCGHYTQVVWSSSREVGCGYHLCSTLSSTTPTLSNAYYLVCNYGPAGNVDGVKPFTKGTACSKCNNGAGWCKDGLCNSACSSPGENCLCSAICYNCAKLDADTCRCTCANGWHGVDCSAECKNTDARCNANPGWPPSWCNHTQFGADVRRGCPVMCDLCTPDASVVPGQCPPVVANGTVLITTTTTASASTVFARCQQAKMVFAMLAFISVFATIPL